MKKIFVLLVAFVMALSLFSCGGTSSSGDDADKEGENGKKEKITFSELLVVDNEECFIKITGIDPDNLFGYSLKVQLENKSSEKTYMFSLEDSYVNGVECPNTFATEVAPGKKSNDDITLLADDLKENGIEYFSDIELSFKVYDSNDWSAEPVAEETVNVYPYGEDKAEKFVRESKDSDNVIIDNDKVTVVVLGYEDDEIWGYTVKLYLLNKTDKNIMFSIEEASVNGYMADPYFATSLSSGKCEFASVSWSDSTFEENGITSVEEIEFILRAYDYDNILGGDLVKETVKLNP